jgi:hypothetical protein
MIAMYHGSCLCGAVRFEVQGTIDAFYLCHCEYCRKDTGSAHASNLFSSTAKLTWLSGEHNVTSFTLPSTRHAKSFCSVCGSALPNLQMDGKLLVIPAGSIDNQLALKPSAHIFAASRADWDRELDKVKSMEKFPA